MGHDQSQITPRFFTPPFVQKCCCCCCCCLKPAAFRTPPYQVMEQHEPKSGEPSAAGTGRVSEGHRFDRGRSSAWIQSRSSMKTPPQHQTKDGGRGREEWLCSSGTLALLAAADCLITWGCFHFGARRRDLCSGRQQDSAVQEHRPTETG